MKKLFTFILLGFISVLFFGCGQHTDESGENTLNIYTTIYPIQYAVERIGGEHVSSRSVYPPGVDAHTYEPTTKDMTTIARSDAFIYLGAGMEGFAESAANTLQSTHVNIIEIGSHKELFHTETDHHHQEHEQEHAHGDVDPHIWLDPSRLIKAASYIKDALIELKPDREHIFTQNYNNLKEDLLQLDNNFKHTLEQKTENTILVSHAAYGYWEERYGIDQLPIIGLSSSEEPSQRDLTKIIHQAQSKDIHYIIFEQNSSNRVTEIIQDHIDAEALTIHNLAVLTDKDIKQQEDYLSLMEGNLQVLDKALK